MTPSLSKPRRQCAKCPWKKSTNPRDIPHGYCEVRHANLRRTIAPPGDLPARGSVMRVFSCHESAVGAELPCVGWLVQQLGPGNNLALRLAVITGRINGDVRTVGAQHERFEDTLPGAEP